MNNVYVMNIFCFEIRDVLRRIFLCQKSKNTVCNLPLMNFSSLARERETNISFLWFFSCFNSGDLLDGAYYLQYRSQPFAVYCQMTPINECDSSKGGWTLVMKINGSRVSFENHI